MADSPDNQAKLERCAQACAGRGWALAWSLLHHRDDAADCVQQAFLVAARKPHRVPADDPWPWLAAVIAREARNARRKRRPAALEGADMPLNDAGNDPAARAQRRERDEALVAALNELPEPEREALLLTQFAGLTYADAACAAAVPVGTLNTRISRALEKLRRRLGRSDAAILGCIPLLPVEQPPAGLLAFLTSPTAGSAAATVTIGGLAVKKSLILAGALVLVAILGVAGALVVVHEGGVPNSGPMQARQEPTVPGTTAAPADPTPPVPSSSRADAMRPDDTETREGSAAPEAPPAQPTENDPPKPPVSNAAKTPEVDEVAAELDKEPVFTSGLTGPADPRNIATLGGAEPWTEQDQILALAASPDGSSLFAATETRVSRWNALLGEPEWTMETSMATISSLALSPDGASVAIGSNHNWIVVLDAGKGTRKRAIASKSSTTSLAYSADGLLLAAGQYSAVTLFRTGSGEPVRSHYAAMTEAFPQGMMRNVRFSADGKQVCAAYLSDGFSGSALYAWNVETGECTRRVTQQELGLVFGNSAAFSRDGRAAIVAALPAEGHVMTFEDYLREHPVITPGGLSEEEQPREAARIYAQRRQEYSEYRKQRGEAKESAQVPRLAAYVNLVSKTVEHRIQLDGSEGADVMLALDARDTVLGIWQGRNIGFYNYGLWSRRAETTLATRTNALAFDSAAQVAYANNLSRIVRFRTTDGTEIAPVQAAGLKPENRWLSMFADGSAVLFKQGDEMICWEIASRSVLWRKRALTAVDGGGAMRDGSAVIACDAKNLEPLLLEPRTGEIKRRLAWPDAVKRNFVVAAPDGTLASLTGPAEDKTEFTTEFIVWQPSTDYQPRRIAFDAGEMGLMGALAISPDGRTLACAAWQGHVIADVNAGTARLVQPQREFMNNLRLAFTPDGRELLVVALGLNGSVLRINVGDGSSPGLVEFGKLEGMAKSGPVSAFLVAPDGRSLLVAPYSWNSVDPTILRLELAPPRIADRYPGHPQTINCMAQSADGRVFASISDDRVLRVWRSSE